MDDSKLMTLAKCCSEFKKRRDDLKNIYFTTDLLLEPLSSKDGVIDLNKIGALIEISFNKT